MEALYFSYASLLTIGYGDYTPSSNAGKAFFVLWSLLAVPSLTILISNMGDTIVKWFSDFTIALGAVTVLPEEKGFRASLRHVMEKLTGWSRDSFANMTLPGVMGAAPLEDEKTGSSESQDHLLDRLAGRLSKHLDKDAVLDGPPQQPDLNQDIRFYHYVLARECRDLQKDSHKSPPKEYKWEQWEYFLRLMGNGEDPDDFPGQERADIQVPEPLRAPAKLHQAGQVQFDTATDHQSSEDARKPTHAAVLSSEKPPSSSSSGEPPSQYFDAQTDGNIDRATSILQHKEHQRKSLRHHHTGRHLTKRDYLRDWSWLSNESPLMSSKTEAEWILERLSAALERELNRVRKGYRIQPPIKLRDAYRRTEGEGEERQVDKEARGRIVRAASEAE